MLRGRIVAANGIKAEDLKPAAGSRWVLQGDRGITYATPCRPARASSPANGGAPIIPANRWFRSKAKPRTISISRSATRITVNVLGRNVTARIANLRAVDWENLGINFVLVFSPGTFGGAPHSDIATLTFADGGTTAEETAVIKALADAFPTVTAVRVKDALDTLDAHHQAIWCWRSAAPVRSRCIAAALVLGGALAAGQRFRIYDAVVLKTFGATRARLTRRLCDRISPHRRWRPCVFGVAMGTLAADLIVTRVMEFPFVLVAGQAAGAALAALVGHGGVGPCRHIHRAWPQARGGACGISDR